MYSLLRPLLFSVEPELAHQITLGILDWLPAAFFSKSYGSPVHCMGLKFSHPVGLAAGLDKDGKHTLGLAKLGFSFIEVGTVTPKPQVGNPKPRLFRLTKDEAIINRMGFNNDGVDALVTRLLRVNLDPVLGINIGKNKDTPLDKASDDYCAALEQVYQIADYVTINISSPNTPDLRRLQEEEYFAQLLEDINLRRAYLSERYQRRLPIALKLSPDESDEQLKRMCDVVLEKKFDAIIATNTTADRGFLQNKQFVHEHGGLSGKPLCTRACDVLRLLKSQVGSELALIGVGGIDSAASALERLTAGADLLQLYSGLIYQGPKIIQNITQEIAERSV